MITLISALIACIPDKQDAKAKQLKKIKQHSKVVATAVSKVLLRSAADEVISHLTQSAADSSESEVLDNAKSKLGDELTTLANHMIESQLALERIRTQEVPTQISALVKQIKSDDTGRLIIIVDELDRCHPDYAIAFLEAMKLVFNTDGLVFVLMVNPDYIENLAKHKFGASTGEELYLDKFIDLRLKLQPRKQDIGQYAQNLAAQLPCYTRYGDNNAFSQADAGKLAAELADLSNISIRKLDRLFLKLELALRCNPSTPIDLPLLIFLSFRNEFGEKLIKTSYLPRSAWTTDIAANSKWTQNYSGNNSTQKLQEGSRRLLERKGAFELIDIPQHNFRTDGNKWCDGYFLEVILASKYIPFHQSILDTTANLMVEN